jgi:hypothetical protein
MKRLLLLSALLASTLLSTPAWAKADYCGTLLTQMQQVMKYLREGIPLDIYQNLAWREWNRDCMDPDWQQALAAGVKADTAGQRDHHKEPSKDIRRTAPPADAPIDTGYAGPK